MARRNNKKKDVTDAVRDLYYATVYGLHVPLPPKETAPATEEYNAMAALREKMLSQDGAYDCDGKKLDDVENRVLHARNWRTADGKQWNPNALRRSLVAPFEGNSVTAYTYDEHLKKLLPQLTLVYTHEGQYSVRAARLFKKGDVVTIMPIEAYDEHRLQTNYTILLSGDRMSSPDPREVQHFAHLCNTSDAHYAWSQTDQRGHERHVGASKVVAGDAEFSAILSTDALIIANRDLQCGDPIEFHYGDDFYRTLENEDSGDDGTPPPPPPTPPPPTPQKSDVGLKDANDGTSAPTPSVGT